MKKFLCGTLAAILAFGLTLTAAACGRTIDTDPKTIVVGASATPHALILDAVKEDLAAAGYTLEVKVFDDYITPNTALEEGSIDANYFQHTPYLNTFNEEYKTHLTAVGKIHYEPFGVYGKGVTQEQFDTLKTGRTILVPNDGSNLTRALFVLRDEGYIGLPADVSPEINLTVHDITDLRGNTVTPVQAENVAQILKESDTGTVAVINGNYALQAGLKAEDALAFEDSDGAAAQLYANVIAVREGNENHPKIAALLDALRSQKVIDFINAEFGGAVQAVFSV